MESASAVRLTARPALRGITRCNRSGPREPDARGRLPTSLPETGHDLGARVLPGALGLERGRRLLALDEGVAGGRAIRGDLASIQAGAGGDDIPSGGQVLLRAAAEGERADRGSAHTGHYESGRLKQCSLDELLAQNTIFLPAIWVFRGMGTVDFIDETDFCANLPHGALLLPTVIGTMRIWPSLRETYNAFAVWSSPTGVPIVELRKSSDARLARKRGARIVLVPLTEASFDIIALGGDVSDTLVVVNENSSFGIWWRDVETARVRNERGSHNLSAISVLSHQSTVLDSYEVELQKLIKLWNCTAALPQHLICPVAAPRVYRRPIPAASRPVSLRGRDLPAGKPPPKGPPASS